MVAKRVSVILREISSHIEANGGFAHAWQVHIVTSIDDVPPRVREGGEESRSSILRQTYSARDAHEVGLALSALGCRECDDNHEITGTVIYAWREATVGEPASLTPPPREHVLGRS